MIRRAFTLLELLIVVLIIAILAAIAVPNMLEAQARAKASRAKADLRTLATGLELYRVDFNHYPLCNNEMLPAFRPKTDKGKGPERWVLEHLSTPIAYVTSSILPDPFSPNARRKDFDVDVHGVLQDLDGDPDMPIHRMYKYGAMAPKHYLATAGFADVIEKDGPVRAYFVASSGPDRTYTATGTLMVPSIPVSTTAAQIYDPTNGTVSYGDIWRVGGVMLPPGGWGGNFMHLVARSGA